MYDYISGKLVKKSLDYACIDINGIAYILYIPFKTYEALSNLNENEKLYTYMQVKEDDIRLFGFKTVEERKIFKLLISISGVGPKIALAILSFYTSSEVVSIIKSEDYKMLSQVNGLGLKKAQKIIIEIKDKVDSIMETNTEIFELQIIKNELKLGLEALGYDKIKIESYLSDEQIKETKDSGILMKEILKNISKKK